MPPVLFAVTVFMRGSLYADIHAEKIGTLNITGNSIIDFTGVSTLNVTNISLGVGASRLPSTTGPTPRITSSPKPDDVAAPASLSTYKPAPIIGESPTRPGIFQERPLVVVTPQI